MEFKNVLLALTISTVVGCAGGVVPSSDPRHPDMTKCGSDLLTFVMADASLSQRIKLNLRTGPQTSEMKSAVEEQINAHPSARYMNLVARDVGQAAVIRSLFSTQKTVADQMANAEVRHGNDKISALQEVLPQLTEQAKSSCQKAGYTFTAIQPMSVIPEAKGEAASSASEVSSEAVTKETVAEPVAQKAMPKPEPVKAKPTPIYEAVKEERTVAIRNANESERAALIAAMSDFLLDSESARYKNFRLVPGKGACVDVNAKNKFGGYTGFADVYLIWNENKWLAVTQEEFPGVCQRMLESDAEKT